MSIRELPGNVCPHSTKLKQMKPHLQLQRFLSRLLPNTCCATHATSRVRRRGCCLRQFQHGRSFEKQACWPSSPALSISLRRVKDGNFSSGPKQAQAVASASRRSKCKCCNKPAAEQGSLAWSLQPSCLRKLRILTMPAPLMTRLQELSSHGCLQPVMSIEYDADI